MNTEYIVKQLHEAIIHLEQSKRYYGERSEITILRNTISDVLGIVGTLHSQLRFQTYDKDNPIDRKFDTPIAYYDCRDTNSPGFITEREASLIRIFRGLDANGQFRAIGEWMNLQDKMKFSEAAEASQKVLKFRNK